MLLQDQSGRPDMAAVAWLVAAVLEAVALAVVPMAYLLGGIGIGCWRRSASAPRSA
jgi:hypothetical protein